MRGRRWVGLSWAVVWAAPVVVGLAGLGTWLFLMEAMGYGMARLLAPLAEGADIAAPRGSAYVAAFFLASFTAVVAATVLAWLADRRWPAGRPGVRGLVSATVAAPLAVAVLLLRLGIDPVDFALSLV